MFTPSSERLDLRLDVRHGRAITGTSDGTVNNINFPATGPYSVTVTATKAVACTVSTTQTVTAP